MLHARATIVALALAGIACGASPATPTPPVSSTPSARPSSSAQADVPVPFEIGTRSFIAGDELRIDELRGDHADLVVGGKYTLRGRYRLKSHDVAILMLYVTNGDASVDPRRIDLRAGEGPFEMRFTLTALGTPHLSLYPAPNGGDGFGLLYFGHGATLDTTPAPACDDEAAKKLGWILSGGGGHRHDYCATLDDANARAGHSPLHVARRARPRDGSSYATLMKVVDPTPYLGKRVRIEMDVRTQGASGRRDIWSRVQAKSSPGDGAGLGGSWETLPETSDWQRRSIVVDVPLNGASLHYGVGIAGPGELWVDNDVITVVDANVPLTNPPPVVVDGWRLMGVGRTDYAIAADAAAKRGASIPIAWKSATTATASKRYAALVRIVPALDLRGKRVRVTRWVRTKDADEIACVAKIQRDADWTYGAVLGADLEKIPPTRDWYKCESVLDIGGEAEWVLVGITGRGAGQAWVDDAKVEAVVGTTPLTQHSP
jgi:hypothetical protein